MRRVRIVFPTAWDHKQLVARTDLWKDDFVLELEQPSDAECRDDFDILDYVDRAVEGWPGRVDGVFSSSDYPGATVAGAIATGLGIAGSTPRALLTTAHKVLSRTVQSEVVPESTPKFVAIDPDRLDALPEDLPMPCFVKPAKGAFSMFARRIFSTDELRRFLARADVASYRNDYLRIYAALVDRYVGADADPRAFVAERLVSGDLVTVEGYVTGDEVVVLGVVDSLRDTATGSFTGFVYPSGLPDAAQRSMADTCRRLVRRLDLRWTFFNVELMWDPAANVGWIIEINARLCGQFADLYEKVDGVNAYRLALDLACGDVPRWRRGRGPNEIAASFPLRVFAPVRVERVPDAEDLDAAERLFPGTQVWNEVRAGDRLDDFSQEDGASLRYAVVNLGARDRAELDERLGAVRSRLGYELAPLNGSA